MIEGLIVGILEQGLIYGIMAMGVYITYTILDFPDLSVDGTFPLGIAICFVMINNGLNPWLALLAAFAAGCIAGMFTGIFNVKLRIRKSYVVLSLSVARHCAVLTAVIAVLLGGLSLSSAKDVTANILHSIAAVVSKVNNFFIFFSLYLINIMPHRRYLHR